MSPKTSLSGRQLLVSVQNVREAQLARSLGVPWIDLKNPALGSLGRPDSLTARKVAAVLAQGDRAVVCQTSVALGELRTLHLPAAIELIGLFSVAKIGLAGLGARRGHGSALRQQISEVNAQLAGAGELVLAIYADHQRAGAPEPDEVIELARSLGSRHVLIDTFIKDGQGLFQWLALDELRRIGELAASFGATLVVAGSLRSSDWPLLNQLGPLVVGVRGGVCSSNDDRSSRISPERLERWLAWSRLEVTSN